MGYPCRAEGMEGIFKYRDQAGMDEELKQPLLVSVLIANIVIVGYQLIFNMSPFTYGSAFLGVLIGAAVGGGVFAAMFFKNRG